MKVRQRRKFINNSLITINPGTIPECLDFYSWIILTKMGIIVWDSSLMPEADPPSTTPRKNIKAFIVNDVKSK